MIKKIMSFISILTLASFVNVYAYNSYEQLEVANFISTQDEETQANGGALDVGTYELVLDKTSSDEQFVRTLSAKIFLGDKGVFNNKEFKKGYNAAFDAILEQLEKDGITSPYIKSAQENLELLKLTDIEKFPFNESIKDDNGNLKTTVCDTEDCLKVWNSGMNVVVGNSVYTAAFTLNTDSEINTGAVDYKYGFYTQIVSSENDKDYVWVIEFEYANEKFTKLTFKPVEISDYTKEVYAVVPVLYFDKTYDCKAEEEACYVCTNKDEDKTFVWKKVGTQDTNCELVPDVKAKDKCATVVKTGVEENILALVLLVAVGACVIVVINRKSLFSNL